MEQEPISPDEVLRVAEKVMTEITPQRSATEHLHLSDTLDKKLSLDSLARIEFLSRMEKQFNCHFSDQDFSEIEDLRDVFFKILKAQGLPSPAFAKEAFEQGPRQLEPAPSTLKTLVEVLNWHEQNHGDFVHVRFDDKEKNHGASLTYAELATKARAIAAGLQKRGFKKNDKIVLMLPTGPEYLCSFFGVLYAGGVPVPIYPLARPQQLEDHVQRHRYILANSAAVAIIAPAEVKPLAQLLKFQTKSLHAIVLVDELMNTGESFLPPPCLPTDLALIQYTSGSTGRPKGVQITHDNILANIRAMGEALHVSPQDFVVSWLPLYHDMGLIGAWLGSLYFSVGVVLMSPLRFLSHPEHWLWALHRYKASISAGPNFAYELCVHRTKSLDLEGLDLSSVRALLNGAEAVSPETLERFLNYLAGFGLKREAIMPVYGLAESSVGLSFPPLGRGFVIDSVDRDSYMREGKAHHVPAPTPGALRFVSCGVPLPQHQIRVVDSFQHELPENSEGEIQFRGPSATSGYYDNSEQNKKLFSGSWLNTGDRGYFFRGELFITGRIKDIIIRGGRHIYPQEIEDAVGKIPGVRKGRIVAFGGHDPQGGTEKLVVVAETHETRPAQLEDLRAQINHACMNLAGDPPEDVVLTAPGSILKTSSGKLRRAATRDLYEQGHLGLPSRALWLQVLSLVLQGLQNKLRMGFNALLLQLYALYGWTLLAILAPMAWLLAMVLPKLEWRWACMRGLARFLFSACAVKIHIDGDITGLQRKPPQIVVSNHSSYLDALVLMTFLPRPVSFVAKTELSKYFLLAIALKRLRVEFVERFKVEKSLQDMSTLEKSLQLQRSLFFFPEGTFVRDPGLLPFHSGAFYLAAKWNLPVLPLVLNGTRNILRSDSWFPRRGPIEIVIGAPLLPSQIPGENFTDLWSKMDFLKEKTRDFISQHLREIHDATIMQETVNGAWEHFPHGSDIGIRGKGEHLSEAFAMVAMALNSLMGDPHQVTARETLQFEIEAETLDFLLFDWVNRLIYESAVHNLLFAEFRVEVNPHPPRLTALIKGEKIDRVKHHPGVEVKGATFTELKVQHSDNQWICQCIVDV